MPYYTGICGCCSDYKGCMDVIFCPCCQVGRQCAAVKGQPDQMECMPCFITCLLAVPSFQIAAVCLRSKVAEKYMLEEEGCCSHVCCGCLCTGLSLCQTSRELNLRDANTGGTCYNPDPKMN